MDAGLRQRYMQVMGIPVWMPKGRGEVEVLLAPPMQTAVVEPLSFAIPDTSQPTTASDCSHLSWQDLRAAVQSCTRCALAKTRTQAVFGTGDMQARWMIIGEAPGADEDRRGEPFVGRAGQLLNNMLAAVGLPRESVYIANVLKCRPPNNRDPKVDEAANCRGYLERQIELVNPTLILVVGRIAAQNLLHTDAPLARLRGKQHRAPVSGTPVVVTYHPAYLLRQPADKRKAWEDLQFAREILATHVN